MELRSEATEWHCYDKLRNGNESKHLALAWIARQWRGVEKQGEGIAMTGIVWQWIGLDKLRNGIASKGQERQSNGMEGMELDGTE